jgi:hypothetical protein
VAPCTQRGKKKKLGKWLMKPNNLAIGTQAHGKTKTKELELKTCDKNGKTKMGRVEENWNIYRLWEVVDWYLFLSHLENVHKSPAIVRHISHLSND